ncbi:hypothetical protein [Singulisphaera sp. PoT]|uniref:hypothetical protein n=1 Tax=Singulisphaera sp. PoT TaxID=3411797 RepID=UPI003BF5E825
MSTRKLHPRNRSLKPTTEGLEDRRLLSATVTGTDSDGDTWSLRLIGPGDISVTKQNGADGQPGALDSATEINTITIAGTDPTKTRLVGSVVKGANGDGKVFFQTLNKIPSNAEGRATGNGLLSISMPSFWLGNTTPYTSTSTSVPTAPSITVPDGVGTLQFGGVDTTHDQPTTPPSLAQSDQATIQLGPALHGGTSIIIDKSISSTATIPASGTSTTPTTIQHGVVFEVSGRLTLFQANSIDGNEAIPPGQFSNSNSAATGFGGTWVVSGTPGSTIFFGNPQILGGLTGQIGNLRIGGNATNFTTAVYDTTGNSGAKITNYSIGGETSNVMVVAPNGIRNMYFGNGMDQTQVYTHVLNTLQANRGAIGSTIQTDRAAGKLTFGGDVVNTNVFTGYGQSYGDLVNNITGAATSTTSLSPVPPSSTLNAQVGGGMTVLVAGDVTNSVFTASVQPDSSGVFGTDQDLKIAGAHIDAKVEGNINNSSATPDKPSTAFYAQNVNLKRGPVIPPNVPQEPYSGGTRPTRSPGVPNVNPTHLGTVRAHTQTARSTPRGPRST